jgi:hypothetical protein
MAGQDSLRTRTLRRNDHVGSVASDTGALARIDPSSDLGLDRLEERPSRPRRREAHRHGERVDDHEGHADRTISHSAADAVEEERRKDDPAECSALPRLNV